MLTIPVSERRVGPEREGTGDRTLPAVEPGGRDAEGEPGERRIVQGGLATLQCAEWADRFPDLVQGVTLRTAELDFGRGRAGPQRRENREAWDRLRRALGFRSVVRCRQVHGDRVLAVDEPGPGPSVLGEADGLVTDRPGILLTVTVADCVPVFALDPSRGVLGLAHAGWRGLASGVIESFIDRLVGLGATPGAIRLYCGPGICGRCYEVGPEVPRALGLPGGRDRVDLIGLVIERAAAAGIPQDRVRRSRMCTLEDRDRLLSYRGGDVHARMCAFLGRLAVDFR